MNLTHPKAFINYVKRQENVILSIKKNACTFYLRRFIYLFIHSFTHSLRNNTLVSKVMVNVEDIEKVGRSAYKKREKRKQ